MSLLKLTTDWNSPIYVNSSTDLNGTYLVKGNQNTPSIIYERDMNSSELMFKIIDTDQNNFTVKFDLQWWDS